jgi:hypothetical protein
MAADFRPFRLQKGVSMRFLPNKIAIFFGKFNFFEHLCPKAKTLTLLKNINPL